MSVPMFTTERLLIRPYLAEEYETAFRIMDRCFGDGNRVIFKWRTVLSNIDERPGGYEFAGITILEYAGSGKFSLQEDIYNMKECEKVIGEWSGAGGTL